MTIAEGHRYPGAPLDDSERSKVWENIVSEGGWLGRPPEVHTEPARSWLMDRRRAGQDHQSTAFATRWSLDAAHRAIALWRELLRTEPKFHNAAMPSGQIVVHAFGDPELLAHATKAHQHEGSLRKTLSVADLATRAPALRAACGSRILCGGLEIDGFAINITRLTRALLGSLERNGVKTIWNAECTGVRRVAGRAAALVFTCGDVVADHFALFPGAYSGPKLLNDLGLRVCGIAGRWLRLPQPPGLDIPFKCSLGPGARSAADINVMPYFDEEVGRDMLAVSGGCMHVGEFPFQYDEIELHALDSDLERTLHQVLPDAVEEAKRSGTLIRSHTLCVRSFSVNDAPAIATIPTATGGILLAHAGLNTAGAALAPAIAESTVAFLTSPNERAMRALGASVANLEMCSPKQ